MPSSNPDPMRRFSDCVENYVRYRPGYPRNVILGHHEVASFDAVAFNADVRAGRLVGTNGPMLASPMNISCHPDRSPSCR